MIALIPITLENALTFKAVRLEALKDSPLAFGSTYANESKIPDDDWHKRAVQWSTDRSIAYIAMDTFIPCGIAASFIDKDDKSKAHLVSMWVAPTHRKMGIGQTLVTAIIDWARLHNIQTLRLTVTCTNTIAIKFYERLAFTKTGNTEPYPNDPALFEYEMCRQVSP